MLPDALLRIFSHDHLTAMAVAAVQMIAFSSPWPWCQFLAVIEDLFTLEMRLLLTPRS
jgi:hypothetical protein